MEEQLILQESRDGEEVRRDRRRFRYRRLLALFFLCMLIFTVLSRIIDSYQVARVTVLSPARSTVTKTVEGSGVVEAGETTGIRTVKGLIPGRILAGTGSRVKAGDILFYYDSASMEEKRRSLSKEIQKLELQMEQERIGAVSYAGVTRTELAAQELSSVNRDLELQRSKSVQAVSEQEEKLNRIQYYYDKRLALSKEELVNQSRSDFYASQNEYESARLNQDTELRSIERKIKETQKKLDRIMQDKEKNAENAENSENAENAENSEADKEDKIEELEELLAQYEEELEAASEKWDLDLTHERDKVDDKEDIYARAKRGTDSARLALQENYETALAQEKKNLEAFTEAELKAVRAAEAAAQAVENAKRDDSAAALNQEQQKRLARLRCEALQPDLEEKREELAILDALICAGGAVTAPCDGAVAAAEIEQGRELAGTERYLVSFGDLVFKGTFDREENSSISVYDEVSIQWEGEQTFLPVAVQQVDLVTSEDKGTFTGSLLPGTASLGAKAFFSSVKHTDLYNTVIPLRSLRRDTAGDFCLVMRAQKGILGEEFQAVRVNVKLLYSGDTEAAVEGALQAEDMVISGSDRVVSAGDRVRLVAGIGGE